MKKRSEIEIEGNRRKEKGTESNRKTEHSREIVRTK